VVTVPDGSLFWTSWQLGEGETPWTAVPINGPSRFTDVAPAVSFRTTVGGTSVWMAIKDRTDGQIYETLQQPGGTFLPWTRIPGITTKVAPAVSDGNLAIGYPFMAVLSAPPDGVTYINVFLSDQPPNPPPPGYWGAVNPSPFTSMAPALALVDNGKYMFLAATVISFSGPNSHVVLYQGSPYRPDQLVSSDAGFDSNVSPAMAAAHNRTVIVAVNPNGAMSYNWWDFGGGGHGWVSLGNNVTTKVAPAVSLVDEGKYMFIFAQGINGKHYLNQGNVGGSIVGWQPA
jgi:hypothetical protein